jgi:glycosyltransferase involved in cell wall biosynthesis
MLQSVYRQSKEYDVALVEIYSGPAFVWAEIVCTALRLLRKPYILALYGGNLPQFSQRVPVRMRRLLGSAQRVICPSAFLARQLKHLGTALEILPYAIDLPRYEFRCRSKPCPTLVWLRSFHEIYNPTLAVEAMAIMRRQWPDIRFAKTREQPEV